MGRKGGLQKRKILYCQNAPCKFPIFTPQPYRIKIGGIFRFVCKICREMEIGKGTAKGRFHSKVGGSDERTIKFVASPFPDLSGGGYQ